MSTSDTQAQIIMGRLGRKTEESASTASSASDAQARQLTGEKRRRPEEEVSPATGDYARLRELMLQDEPFTDAEEEEFDELSARHRKGDLTGRPAGVRPARRSVSGDGDREGEGESRIRPSASSSEAQAAAIVRSRT